MSTMVLGQRGKVKVMDGGAWLMPLLVILIGVALIGTYFGAKRFLASSYFRVKEIRWGGVTQIDPVTLNKQFQSVLGKNLVALNLSEMHSSLQSNGWVKEAVVRKVFPDRVDVMITERVPAAVELDPNSSKMVLRDVEGVIIETVKEGTRGELPRVIYYNPRAYAKALELAPLLSTRPEAMMNLSRPDDIWVYLKGGVLRFGDRDYQSRWKQFTQVEPDLKRRESAPWEADLRFPAKVVVRKKSDSITVASNDQDVEY